MGIGGAMVSRWWLAVPIVLALAAGDVASSIPLTVTGAAVMAPTDWRAAIQRCEASATADTPALAQVAEPWPVVAIFSRPGLRDVVLTAGEHTIVCDSDLFEFSNVADLYPNDPTVCRPPDGVMCMLSGDGPVVFGRVAPQVTTLFLTFPGDRTVRANVVAGAFALLAPKGAELAIAHPRAVTFRALAADGTVLYDGPLD